MPTQPEPEGVSYMPLDEFMLAVAIERVRWRELLARIGDETGSYDDA